MSDQFFPQPEKPTAPAETPAPETVPPKPDSEPLKAHESPSLPPLPSSLTGPSQLARDAHHRTRRLLTMIIGIVFLLIVIVSLLIWQLAKSPAAPTSSNATTVNTQTNTSTKPEPSLNSPLPSSNSSSAGTAGWPAMTADFVKNLTYPTDPRWKSVNGWKDTPDRFTLINGVSRFDGGWYIPGENADRITVHLTVYVKDEAIGTGDIDGDGLADAVAVLKWTDGGTGAFPLVYTVFGNQPYSPVLNNDVLAGIVGGSYSAQKVTLSRETLVLQLSFPKAGDANCCWTGQANVTLKLVNGQWQS